MQRPNPRSRRAVVAILVALVAATLASRGVHAGYPDRLIKLIVPFPAGGLVDGVARVLQGALEQELGQPVIIENRPGASGVIGSDAVAKAPPDGYTLLLVASSHTVTPVATPKLPYDIERDLTGVGLVVSDPLLFIVSDAVPARSLSEFVALAKRDPGKLMFGTPGTSSQATMVTNLFSQRAGISMLEVPYRGGAPAMLALMSGEVQFAVMSTQLSAPQIEAGKVRALAAGGERRSERFPAVPTLAETGFAEVPATQWVGLLAPGPTPREIVTRLNAALERVLDSAEVRSRLAGQGMSVAKSSPEEFQALIAAEIRQWSDQAKSAKARF